MGDNPKGSKMSRKDPLDLIPTRPLIGPEGNGCKFWTIIYPILIEGGI